MAKMITVKEAAELIKNEARIGVGAMGLAGWPEEIGKEIEQRFLKKGEPKNLTVIQGSNTGDRKERGITRLGHEGLLKRWIGAHVGFSQNIVNLIQDNKIEAYCLPQGTLVNLWRETAAGRPGLISKVGLRTFVDPRNEGGKMNAVTEEEIVKHIEFENEEWLFYKTQPIDVALLRGSTIDENGNLSMEKEGIVLEQIQIAQAAKNSGGIVIAQAEYLAEKGTLHPKDVKVPGILVDYYVIAEHQESSWQTEAEYYEPSFAGDLRIPLDKIKPLPLSPKKIIARRAALELEPDSVINLGVGVPADVSAVASEEGISDKFTLTTEAGGVGGVPAGGQNFGHSYNSEASIEHNAMFDFYDGGGLDLAILGLAQTDNHGNVNVSKFGRPMGPGGFINITQNSKKVIFTGTFTAKGLDVTIENNAIAINKEGQIKKFVDTVEQITFSGSYASEIKQEVLYITERAVFKVENGLLTLVEIAPGIDLEKDILNQMDFKPVISDDLKIMPEEIFQPSWGKLKERFN